MITQKITPCLWFDSEAEDAAKLYTSIFKNSSIGDISRYGKEGFEFHHKAPGTAMVVSFTLDGQAFTALNGGPIFKFNEAISLQVYCESQAEIDSYWEKLSQGGDPKAQQCGWLKDKYGLSWQVVPDSMDQFFKDHTSPKTERAMMAMLEMKKIDLEKLKRAYEG